jgi:hypothetical protein
MYTGTLPPVLVSYLHDIWYQSSIYWYGAGTGIPVHAPGDTRSAAVLPPPSMKASPEPTRLSRIPARRARESTSPSRTVRPFVIIPYLTLFVDLYCLLTHTGEVAHTLPTVARACAPLSMRSRHRPVQT